MNPFKFFLTSVPLVICLCSTLFADVYTVPSTEYTDGHLRSGNPTSSYSSGLILTGTVENTDIMRSVFAFDLSHIGAGSSVSGVNFTLTHEGPDSGTSVNATVGLDLYELDQSFVSTQASWNNYSSGNAWTTPGGDFSTKLASSTGNPENAAGTEVLFSSTGLTSAVESSAGGVLYLLVKLETEANDRRIFRFEDEGDPDRPSLEINYTANPEPSTLMLVALTGISGLLLSRKRRK